MTCPRNPRSKSNPETAGPQPRGRRFGFWKRWILANTLISGILALAWLVLRSGPRPNRLVYPCQQAALSTATLAFGAPIVATAIAARRRVIAWARAPLGIAAAAIGLVLTSGIGGYLLWADEYRGPAPAPPLDYEARIYHVTDCPPDPVGDRLVGVDNLLATLGRDGVKLHDSATETPISGPGGILGADDVVLVKINYQWDERGGTNVDLLRGLIRRILDHPDGFTGEVVVCENAQFNSVENFDLALNNAQDHGLSPHDVVVAYQTAGHDVSHSDWTALRYTAVTEYDAGNLIDGYVVYPYDAELHGRVSYPKFRTSSGTYVSLRHGLWNPATATYDRDRLKFINVPVLKSHHAVYGATAAVKHYMGVATRELSTSSHSAIRYGVMGALLGEIGLADLNILDAIWVNANPYDGPWTTYAGATRRDELVASLDPVALDLWAVKNVLIPAFLANGYSPPWPNPSADPDDPGSAFREYLDNSMSRILLAGLSVTNDLGQIVSTTRNGGAGDLDGDSDVDSSDYAQFAACFTGPGGGPVGPSCSAADFDADGDVDCDDFEQFRFVWTGAGAPPDLPECDAVGVDLPGSADSGTTTALTRAFPNPVGPSTRIEFTIATPGPVTLKVHDVAGKVVRTLVDESRGRGEHAVVWNGKGDGGRRVASGVYFCRLEASGARAAKRLVLLK